MVEVSGALYCVPLVRSNRVQLFQKPISEKSLSGELPFTPEEVNTMFAGVTNIIAVNTELLKGLVQRMKNWSDTQKLGDLILNMVSLFVQIVMEHLLMFAGTLAKNVHPIYGELRARTSNFGRTQGRSRTEFL